MIVPDHSRGHPSTLVDVMVRVTGDVFHLKKLPLVLHPRHPHIISFPFYSPHHLNFCKHICQYGRYALPLRRRVLTLIHLLLAGEGNEGKQRSLSPDVPPGSFRLDDGISASLVD